MSREIRGLERPERSLTTIRVCTYGVEGGLGFRRATDTARRGEENDHIVPFAFVDNTLDREAVKKRGTFTFILPKPRAWGSESSQLWVRRVRAFVLHSSCSILSTGSAANLRVVQLSTSPGKGRFVASPRLRCPRVKLTRRCRTLSPRRSSQQQWRSRLRSSAGASRPVLDLGRPNSRSFACLSLQLLPMSPWSSPWRRALFCCLQHRLRRPDGRRDGQRRPAHLNEDEGNGRRRRASGLL